MGISRRAFIENRAIVIITAGMSSLALSDSAPMVSESDPAASALDTRQMHRASTRRNSLTTPRGNRIPTASYFREPLALPRVPVPFLRARLWRRRAAQAPDARAVGEKTCIACHQLEADHFTHTLHALGLHIANRSDPTM
jgi:hypothetical protein